MRVPFVRQDRIALNAAAAAVPLHASILSVLSLAVHRCAPENRIAAIGREPRSARMSTVPATTGTCRVCVFAAATAAARFVLGAPQHHSVYNTRPKRTLAHDDGGWIRAPENQHLIKIESL